jgi:hypothetical protein
MFMELLWPPDAMAAGAGNAPMTQKSLIKHCPKTPTLRSLFATQKLAACPAAKPMQEPQGYTALPNTMSLQVPLAVQHLQQSQQPG